MGVGCASCLLLACKVGRVRAAGCKPCLARTNACHALLLLARWLCHPPRAAPHPPPVQRHSRSLGLHPSHQTTLHSPASPQSTGPLHLHGEVLHPCGRHELAEVAQEVARGD